MLPGPKHLTSLHGDVMASVKAMYSRVKGSNIGGISRFSDLYFLNKSYVFCTSTLGFSYLLKNSTFVDYIP